MEKFVLAMLSGAFLGLVIVNSMKLDILQRIGIGICILGLSIFVAQTIHLNNARKAVVLPVPVSGDSRQSKDDRGVGSARSEAPGRRSDNRPKKVKPNKPKPQVKGPTFALSPVGIGRMENSLRANSSKKGKIRIVFFGQNQPEIVDQLDSAFSAAGWRIENFQIGSNTTVGWLADERLYLLTPDPQSATTSTVISALNSVNISAPIHLDLPTLGPASMGIPDVTIVISEQESPRNSGS